MKLTHMFPELKNQWVYACSLNDIPVKRWIQINKKKMMRKRWWENNDGKIMMGK